MYMYIELAVWYERARSIHLHFNLNSLSLSPSVNTRFARMTVQRSTLHRRFSCSVQCIRRICRIRHKRVSPSFLQKTNPQLA